MPFQFNVYALTTRSNGDLQPPSLLAGFNNEEHANEFAENKATFYNVGVPLLVVNGTIEKVVPGNRS